MTSSEITARKLDLAARAIDVTQALIQMTSSPPGSLIKGAWEIGQWLGRERLNQHELEDCMQKAKGLVTANQNGRALFDDIIHGVESRPLGPLFLEQAGSLGRLLARDPNLSWMISTVACIFEFHRDTRFVAQTLTAFIMRANAFRQPDNATPITDFLTYNPAQVQIYSVINKIVTSIWHNVINAGCDTIPLPEELLSICRRGHYLDPDDFSIVAHTLNSQCRTKAILRSDHLLRNITLWLLLHYDGLLVVNVGGKIIYERDFGNPTRELEIHVKSSCLDGEPCDEARGEAYEILQAVAGKFEHFLSGHSFSSSDIPPQPGIRQKLYEVPRWYPEESPTRSKGFQKHVKCAAQSIMRWMLQVPVLPQQGFSELGFSAALDQSMSNEPNLRIINIFKRVPAMVNLNWGIPLASHVVFVGAHPQSDLPKDPDESAMRDDIREDPRLEDLEKVLLYFPILEDLVKTMHPDCRCGDCQKFSYRVSNLKHGCLQRIALEEVMVLVAHGIADGFNVNDVSAVTDMTPIIAGMTVILLELGEKRKIRWDSWFMLAASVYLGCPFKLSPHPQHPAFGGTAFAAIQYGNLAAQAPWLDLSNELDTVGCFGLIGARGRLGVITKSSSRDEVQFRSLEENFAIVETEGTEDTSTFNSRFKKDPTPPGSAFVLRDDDCIVNSDVVLISVHENFYRLLLRIKTPHHWRVIDPSDAMNSIIRAIPFHKCLHKSKGAETAVVSTKCYTFEELLGRWPDTVQSMSTDRASSGTSHMHLSHILDTHLKQNVALALSVCTTAIQNYPSSSCFSCAIEHARETERELLRDGEGGNKMDRYIINLSPTLRGRRRRGLKELMQSADGDNTCP